MKHTMSMYQTKDAMIESMQADIDSLETENTDMFDRFNDEITDLRAQLAEAREDSELLEFLIVSGKRVYQTEDGDIFCSNYPTHINRVFDNARDAIRNAMKGGE